MIAGLAGCGHKSNEPNAQGSAAAPIVAKDAAIAIAIDAAAAPEMTAEERAAVVAYAKAMRAGRKATAAKNYADAIKAFDAALAAKKNDARALGERGYARLLDGKDLDAASSDLDDAAGRTKDAKILAQVWFNRGLVAEKRDEGDNALVAFYVANKLHSSAAARKKLEGKKVCPVIVSHKLDLETHATVTGKDWLELAKAMDGVTRDDFQPPTTVKEARVALVGDDKEPQLPTVVIAGHAGMGRIAYVVASEGKGLRAYAIGEDAGGRCPGTIDFDVTRVAGTRIHVHGTELPEGGYTDMCEKAGELQPCDDSPDETPHGTACFGGTPSERDLVIDTAAGKVVLVVERPQLAIDDPLAKVTAQLTDTGLELGGLDCDRTEPFAGSH